MAGVDQALFDIVLFAQIIIKYVISGPLWYLERYLFRRWLSVTQKARSLLIRHANEVALGFELHFWWSLWT